MKPKVILIPFPLTTLSAFGYFFLRHAGVTGSETLVRQTAFPKIGSSKVELGGGCILNFASCDLYSFLVSLLPQAPCTERYFLKRFLTFANSGNNQSAKNLARWIAEFSLVSDGAVSVLEMLCATFGWCLGKRIDPWKANVPLPWQEDNRVPISPPHPPGKRIITLPVFKSQESDEREIVSTGVLELKEGRIFSLQPAHIGIAVCGPQGSGKSTLAASLVSEMKNIVSGLCSRGGQWNGFELLIELADLDLGTPTAEEIMQGAGKNREVLRSRKQPWTKELAYAALDKFAHAKSRVGLVIADIPGRIDELTEIVAALADYAILITGDWAHMGEWQKFARRMGITILSQIRSRPSGEGITSAVRRYEPGRIITGRIVDLDRVNRSWDRFVLWLAEFLLFDILPSHIEERRKKLVHELSILKG